MVTGDGSAPEESGAAPATELTQPGTGSVTSANEGTPSQLIPSDDGLPGMSPSQGRNAHGNVQSSPQADPRLLAAGDGSGWENTNARVQHILSADTGDGELSKIVLNVPVLYETRTMRWTLTDVEKARDILTRLMVYENNLSKLKQEGKVLLADWNRLLEKTVPASSLRADSPSLPYNHSNRSAGDNIQDSGSSIKIEQ